MLTTASVYHYEGRYITQLLVAGGEAKPERASQALWSLRFNLSSPLVY